MSALQRLQRTVIAQQEGGCFALCGAEEGTECAQLSVGREDCVTCVKTHEMVPKTMVYSHNGILRSRETEGAYTLCNSMDGTGEHYDK